MKKNVLIVDDDQISNYVTSHLLKRLKLFNQIVMVNNGLEALSKLGNCSCGSECPDLIILDQNMPVMNGLEFLEAFKRIESFVDKCKILVLSSGAEREKEKFIELGVDHFLEKPLTSQSILKIFNQYFHSSNI